MHVLRRGQMEVRYRGPIGIVHAQLLRPTLLLFLKPVHHEFINPPIDGSGFTCASLDFDGGDRNPIVQSLPAAILIPLDEMEGIEPTLALLFSEADKTRCGSRLLVDRLFEVVLIQVLRWIIDHPVEAGVAQGMMMGLSDPRLARCLSAVHEKPQEEWSLERMAGIAGMSRSAFASAFKAATGISPVAYVLDWRLSVATSRLRDGRPIKQLASDLGFADAPSLSKAFRKRMGMSPGQWLATQKRSSPQSDNPDGLGLVG